MRENSYSRGSDKRDQPLSRRRARRPLAIVLVLLFGGMLATAVVASNQPEISWRTRVLAHKIAGDLPDLPLLQVVEWLRPKSPVWLFELAEMPNPHVGIRNRFLDADSEQRGGKIYRARCTSCHGAGGRGESAPDLVRTVADKSDWSFFSTVKWGRPGTPMVAQSLNDTEIWQVHAHLRSNALERAAETERRGLVQRLKIEVAPELIADRSAAGEWLTYAGNYAGHRHSTLAQITRENAEGLSLKWTRQLRTSGTPLQSSPIVAAGVMFVTESRQGAVALDAMTGAEIWRFERAVPDDLQLCCGEPNRGAAILGDTLFLTTLDAHLVALDAATGTPRWIVKVADHTKGYTMTGAPLALNDRVVIGVAGGEFGIRGFVAAFRASDGAELWRFHTIPEPGSPGSETWGGDSWKTGGAPTWTTGAFDASLGLVYWGTGNPAPLFQGDARPGDNLYSNCVIALDANSGRLVWHFQFTPGDEHDWDSVQQPLLADITWDGRATAAVLWANRNGFFYALDRATGRFLFAKPFAAQNWLAAMEPSGRPIVRREARPSATGSLVLPSGVGATNWWPPSYDPIRKLVYVPAIDGASLYFRGPAHFEKGQEFVGSAALQAANRPVTAAVRAVDALYGNVRWEVPLEHGSPDAVRNVGGILSTRGGVFFVGYKEEFAAYDSDDGRKLWSVWLGGRVRGPPIAYAAGGEERIAVAAGSSLFVFGLP